MISTLRGFLLPTLPLLLTLSGELSAQPDLQVDPAALDFGTITLGSELSDSLVILNSGNSSVDINSATFIRGIHFRTNELVAIRLPPNVFVRPTITFRPTAVGCFRDTLLVSWDQQVLRIPVEGCATAPENVHSVAQYSLEGGAGEVGSKISTHLLLLRDTVQKRLDYPSRLQFSIEYDPDALWPTDVRTGLIDGSLLENLLVDRLDGRISGEVVMPGSIPFSTDEKLITVDWVGLSTGKPVNEVMAGLSGTTAKGEPVDTTVDALVLLEGCILESPGFTQKIAVRRVSVDPVGLTLHVEITMPRGGQGRFAIVDVDGRRRPVEETERKEKEDDGVEMIFKLADLPRGIHALQVSLGSDHLMIPFIRP